MSRIAKVPFTTYDESVGKALDLLGVRDQLPEKGLIVIKPNLTNASKPPVTTPVEAVGAIGRYCMRYTRSEVLIGEGTGSGRTADVYEALGYTDLAISAGMGLVDFNEEGTICLRREDTIQLDEFHLPHILTDAYVISVPVLKDHCFTKTTIAMKNMFGVAPAPVYGGTWNKSKLHSPSTHHSVFDLCIYKKPDLSIVDASTALTGGHLWGNRKRIGCILAGYDPVAVDTVGSRLLGHDPWTIEYLTLAHGKLGTMDDIEYEGPHCPSR
jgi:uncharacterized protein (DUF362 family)